MSQQSRRSLFLQRFKGQTSTISKQGLTALFDCQPRLDTQFSSPSIRRHPPSLNLNISRLSSHTASTDLLHQPKHSSPGLLVRDLNTDDWNHSVNYSHYRKKLRTEQDLKHHPLVEKSSSQSIVRNGPQNIKLPKLSNHSTHQPYSLSPIREEASNYRKGHTGPYPQKLHTNPKGGRAPEYKIYSDECRKKSAAEVEREFGCADEAYVNYNKEQFAEIMKLRFQKKGPPKPGG